MRLPLFAMIGLTIPAVSHAEPQGIPELGVAFIAGPVGQQRTTVGGQAELAWSVGRFGVAVDGSMIGVASDNASTGHSVWLGALGRFALLDGATTRTIQSGAREVVSSSLLLEVVAQREWWNIVEHIEPPPVGPERYTLGIGLAGRLSVIDERAPSLVVGTRLFVRALASDTPVATADGGVHYARDYGFIIGFGVDLGRIETPGSSATIATR